MNHSPDRLAENEYYHGTTCYKAIQILYEGFRFKKAFSNFGRYGTFKQGIYLTKSLSVAGLFGSDYVFKCRLAKGVSVLWLDENYDQKIIDYLKREFSKHILTEPISKVIPKNKNLTRKELIHLLNYRFHKTRWGNRKDRQKWRLNVSNFRQQLLFHKYDGVGETKKEVGLIIFNPSLVEPLELLRVVSMGEKHTLEPANPKKFNWEINQYCTDMTEYFDPEEVPELEHVRSLQLRYCRDNGLL
jgi:hypothetical protein